MSDEDKDKVVRLKASNYLRPIELSEDTDEEFITSSIDVLSPGVFVDMGWQEVVILEEDIPAYIFNTTQAINRTITEKGELVGLPIDEYNHGGLGCGRLIKVYEGVGLTGLKIVQGDVTWNSEGIHLISSNKLRSFSATLNQYGRLILGGSLTNWPASVDAEGKQLLRPVALSQNVGDIKMTPEEIMEQLEVKLAGTIQTSVQDAVSKLAANLQPPQQNTEVPLKDEDLIQLFGGEQQLSAINDALRQQISAQYEVVKTTLANESGKIIAKIHHENIVQQLCDNAVAGKSYALPVKVEDLKTFTLSLNTSQYNFFSKFVESVIDNGLTDLRELGSNQEQNQNLKPLPDHVIKGLQTKKIKKEQLSSPILNLGDLSQYDLSGIVD